MWSLVIDLKGNEFVWSFNYLNGQFLEDFLENIFVVGAKPNRSKTTPNLNQNPNQIETKAKAHQTWVVNIFLWCHCSRWHQDLQTRSRWRSLRPKIIREKYVLSVLMLFQDLSLQYNSLDIFLYFIYCLRPKITSEKYVLSVMLFLDLSLQYNR